MATQNNNYWALGGIGLFFAATVLGLIPSLLDAFIPGVLLSVWVGGSGLALAAMTSRQPVSDPAWSASTTALALEAPRSLEYWAQVELEPVEVASLTPEETSFDEDNWTWAHGGEIVH